MATLNQPTPISDVPWPKRTNKACCSCRRDKIKCDGERPCAGAILSSSASLTQTNVSITPSYGTQTTLSPSACLRRGLAKQKCIDGCPPCRRSRSRCDGGDPCGRCLELGIACSDESVSPSHSIDESLQRSITSTSRPAPAGRAKLACLACRRDNKKCDDNRPCSRCISRVEKCIHVERIPKAVKHRCVNCRKENKKCEDRRPCRHCAELGLGCIDAPRKGFGGTRVKMACGNCRRNKIQCDSERPCRVCVRRGLECTMPSCTCAETGSEPGTCTFCRSQRSKRNSQTHNDSGRLSDDIQSSTIGTPPSATSSLPMYGEPPVYKDYHPQYHAFDQYLMPQEHSLHTGIAFTNTSPRHTYQGNASAQQGETYQQRDQPLLSKLSKTATTFHFPEKQNNLDQRMGMPAPAQSAQRDFARGGDALSGFRDYTNPNEHNPEGYSSRGLDMGTSAPLGDFIIPSTSFPRFSTSLLPLALQTGLASIVSDSPNGGVGAGIGTYEPDGLTGISGLSQAYGPVPMAMPVSVTIPVPQNAYVHNTKNQSAGQTDLHPQLRRSSYYLTSDSRTSQRGGL